MICVPENYSCVEFVLEPLEPNSFDSALLTDRHEHRCLDHRSPRLQNPGACFAVRRGHFPTDWPHQFRFTNYELRRLFFVVIWILPIILSSSSTSRSRLHLRGRESEKP